MYKGTICLYTRFQKRCQLPPPLYAQMNIICEQLNWICGDVFHIIQPFLFMSCKLPVLTDEKREFYRILLEPMLYDCCIWSINGLCPKSMSCLKIFAGEKLTESKHNQFHCQLQCRLAKNFYDSFVQKEKKYLLKPS